MRIKTNSISYDKAFVKYIRYGTPIDISLKADEHTTTHYIWRTKNDDKVRSSHAAYDGKLFAWSNPPEKGHPGKDYNCRCEAEPYVPGETEYIHQEVTSKINDNPDKCIALDLVNHAYDTGENLTLEQIGHLQDIINYYAYKTKGGVFKLVNQQIIDEIRTEKLRGNVLHKFKNSYDFREICYAHGSAIVSGEFQGFVMEHNGILKIKGIIHYRFYDIFSDPLSIREKLLGNSDPKKVDEFYRRMTDLGIKVYEITGEWETELTGEVKLNERDSRYKTP